jgi:hypothetical protein
MTMKNFFPSGDRIKINGALTVDQLMKQFKKVKVKSGNDVYLKVCSPVV